MKFDKNDPRLTDYLLGELSEEERAEVEAALENDSEAQAILAELESVVQLAQEALPGSGTETLTGEQRDAILDAAQNETPSNVRRWSDYWTYGAVAAMLLLCAGIGVYTVQQEMAEKSFDMAMTTSPQPNTPAPRTAEELLMSADDLERLEALGYLGDEKDETPEAEPITTPSRELSGGDLNNPAGQSAAPSVDVLSGQNEARGIVAAKPKKEAGDNDGDGLEFFEASNKVDFNFLNDVRVDAEPAEVAEQVVEDGAIEIVITGTGLPMQESVEPTPAITVAGFSGIRPNGGQSTQPAGARAAGRPAASRGGALAGRAGGRGGAGGRARARGRSGESGGGLQNVTINGNVRVRGNYYDANTTGTAAPELRSPDFGGAGHVSPDVVFEDGGYITRVTGSGFLNPMSSNPADGSSSLDFIDQRTSYGFNGAFSTDANGIGLGRVHRQPPEHNTEAYDRVEDNPFLAVSQNPLSTFSIDVDTAAYSNMRRFLNQGQLPPKDSVRIEELVNYFSYDYDPPTDDAPFSANIEVADCPWNEDHRLARVALKGWEIETDERPFSNLVFLLDVSGSMSPENKLPLVRKAMTQLVNELGENDRVAMVVYAGASGLVLPSTTADQKDKILGALNDLRAGGSTNGGSGIELAYRVARENFIKGGVNRVILATDGDFNVGTTDKGSLVRMVEQRAKSGVFLTVLGFGMGNLKDATLEQLADKGNGNYGYIDTEREARKMMVDQLSGTLVTIAKDVKLQVEFNPAKVAGYRLIGYENRVLKARDFNDDTKDAGEIGAGHRVTALYEVVPAGMALGKPKVDALKYQPAPTPSPTPAPVPESLSDDLMTVKIRYKKPDGDTSTKLEFPVKDEGQNLANASRDLKFAAAVASFGMLLRESPHMGDSSVGMVLDLAESGMGVDKNGYRREFIELVRKADSLGAWRSTKAPSGGTSLALVGFVDTAAGPVALLSISGQRPSAFAAGETADGYRIENIDMATGQILVYDTTTKNSVTLHQPRTAWSRR
jgi:Ca-activated chloride channel family protein